MHHPIISFISISSCQDNAPYIYITHSLLSVHQSQISKDLSDQSSKSLVEPLDFSADTKSLIYPAKESIFSKIVNYKKCLFIAT